MILQKGKIAGCLEGFKENESIEEKENRKIDFGECG